MQTPCAKPSRPKRRNASCGAGRLRAYRARFLPKTARSPAAATAIIRGPMLFLFARVFDPLSLLRSVTRVFKPGGTVVVQTMHAGSFAANMTRGRWPWLVEMRLHYFSRRTLTKTPGQSGSGVLRIFADAGSDRACHLEPPAGALCGVDSARALRVSSARSDFACSSFPSTPGLDSRLCGQGSGSTKGGPGDTQPQKGEIAQGGRQEVHLRDAFPAKNEVDRLFDDSHTQCFRPDKQFREKREVIVFERQRSKHFGSVDAKSGGLVFDSKPEHDPQDDVQRAAQDQLPGRSAVRTSALDKSRSDQDVGIAILHGAEEAGDFLRLVIEVCIHRDDVTAGR